MIIIRMYICICNAITEKAVVEAVNNGAASLGDLQSQLGVATCCGCCAQTACGYLEQNSSSGEALVHDGGHESSGRKSCVSTVLWNSAA